MQAVARFTRRRRLPSRLAPREGERKKRGTKRKEISVFQVHPAKGWYRCFGCGARGPGAVVALYLCILVSFPVREHLHFQVRRRHQADARTQRRSRAAVPGRARAARSYVPGLFCCCCWGGRARARVKRETRRRRRRRRRARSLGEGSRVSSCGRGPLFETLSKKRLFALARARVPKVSLVTFRISVLESLRPLCGYRRALVGQNPLSGKYSPTGGGGSFGPRLERRAQPAFTDRRKLRRIEESGWR